MKILYSHRLSILGLLLAFQPIICKSADWKPYRAIQGVSTWTELDNESIRQIRSEIIEYKVRLLLNLRIYKEPQIVYEATIQGDCSRMRRAVLSTTDGSFKPQELEDVTQGTDAELQLLIACRLVATKIPAPVPPVPPVEQPRQTTTVLPLPTTQKLTSTGTAFIVSAAGYLMTSNHVVADCARIRIRLNRNTVIDASLWASDEDADLAALRVLPHEIKGLASMQISGARTETLGETITVMGYPFAGILGQDIKVTTGVISGQSGPNSDHRLMQISAPVQPGNSGGPIFDTNGRVIGVVAAKLAARFNGENVNFAVRLPGLRSFLELNAIPHSSAISTRQRSITDVARLGSMSVLLVGCYK